MYICTVSVTTQKPDLKLKMCFQVFATSGFESTNGPNISVGLCANEIKFALVLCIYVRIWSISLLSTSKRN